MQEKHTNPEVEVMADKVKVEIVDPANNPKMAMWKKVGIATVAVAVAAVGIYFGKQYIGSTSVAA